SISAHAQRRSGQPYGNNAQATPKAANAVPCQGAAATSKLAARHSVSQTVGTMMACKGACARLAMIPANVAPPGSSANAASNRLAGVTMRLITGMAYALAKGDATEIS